MQNGQRIVSARPAADRTMPERVRGFRWWGKERYEYLEKIGRCIDGFGRAMAFPDRHMLETIRLFDTTGRDGMQTEGAFITSGKSVLENKIALCMRMAEWGVPIIEVGNAVSNPGEIEAIRTVKRRVRELGLETEIVSLGRMVHRDMDDAAKAEADTLHIYSSGSIPHAWVKFNKMPEELMEHIEECVRYARGGFKNIIVSLEDAARSDPDHLVRVGKMIYEAAGRNGIEYNIPDTMGVGDPVYMYGLISYIRSKVPELPLQVHCHNDRGKAVENTMAALFAGVRVAQVTMHGVGERTGNAALEQVVMDMYLNHGIELVNDVSQMRAVSGFMTECFGTGPAPNAPYVGERAFEHTAGVHANGYDKSRKTGFINRNEGPDTRDSGSVYVGFNPGDVGGEETTGIGGLSGGTNVVLNLERFGVSVPEDVVPVILDAVKEMSATSAVSEADFLLMAYAAVMGRPCQRAHVVDIKVSTGTDGPEARVKINLDGQEHEGRDSSGNGTVDVAVKAILQAIGNGAGVKISGYGCLGVGEGSDAPGRATMTVHKGELQVRSSAFYTDITMASIEAFRKGYEAVCALEELRERMPFHI